MPIDRNERSSGDKAEEAGVPLAELFGSLIMIVLANLVPIAGVFWFGWDAFLVVFTYWLEGLVVGFFTLVKIVCTLPGYDPTPGESVRYERTGKGISEHFTVSQMSKWSVIAAFVGIYGGLTLVYGLLVLIFLDGKATVAGMAARLADGSNGLVTVLAIMLTQHAWVFYRDFLRGPEWVKSDPVFHFWGPFGRFILLHILVVIGGVVTRALSLPRFYLVLFIVLKSCGDLVSGVFGSAGPWRRVADS